MRFHPALREVMVVLKVLWQAYFLNNSDAIIYTKNILKPNLLVAQGTHLHFWDSKSPAWINFWLNNARAHCHQHNCWWIFLPLSFCSWTNQLLWHSLYAPSSTTGEIRQGYIYFAAADQKDFSSLQLLRVNQRRFPHTVRSEKRKEGRGASLGHPLCNATAKTDSEAPAPEYRGYIKRIQAYQVASRRWRRLIRVAGRIRGWQLEVERRDTSVTCIPGHCDHMKKGWWQFFTEASLCLQSFSAQSLIPITQAPRGRGW